MGGREGINQRCHSFFLVLNFAHSHCVGILLGQQNEMKMMTLDFPQKLLTPKQHSLEITMAWPSSVRLCGP